MAFNSYSFKSLLRVARKSPDDQANHGDQVVAEMHTNERWVANQLGDFEKGMMELEAGTANFMPNGTSLGGVAMMAKNAPTVELREKAEVLRCRLSDWAINTFEEHESQKRAVQWWTSFTFGTAFGFVLTALLVRVVSC